MGKKGMILLSSRRWSYSADDENNYNLEEVEKVNNQDREPRA
jgi:hypothetical protein